MIGREVLGKRLMRPRRRRTEVWREKRTQITGLKDIGVVDHGFVASCMARARFEAAARV